MAASDSRPASGLVLVILGGWLVLQSLAGNLAGRLRAAAGLGNVGTAKRNALIATDPAKAIALQDLIKEQLRAGGTVADGFAQARAEGVL